MSKHIFYISSWYPRADKSEGTFIESQLLALREQKIRSSIMHTEEYTLANFTRAYLSGKKLITQRAHPHITAVQNVVVHRLPLRFSTDPVALRKKNLINGAIKTLQKYIDTNGRPDVLLHHGIFNFTYITEALSQHFSIPYWFMEHSSLLGEGVAKPNNSFHSSAQVLAFVQEATRRFAVSQYYANEFSKRFDAPFLYCPNVLTADFFVAINTTKNALPFRFVNIGILEPHKNQELLIRAFAKNYTGNASFSLTIAGHGTLAPYLRDLIVQLGVAHQVSITGFLNREAIKSLLQESHILVLSSTHETFGVVLAEAMAFGLPVIAPDIGGPAELINPQVGITFAVGNVADLAEKMNKMYHQYSSMNYSAISESARQRFGSATFVKYLFDER